MRRAFKFSLVASRAARGVVDRAADGDGLHVRPADGRNVDRRASVRRDGRSAVPCAPADGRSLRRTRSPRVRRSMARRRRVPEVEVLGAAARARFAVSTRPARRPVSFRGRAELAAERGARSRRANGRRSRSVAETLGSWNFLLDATYGSSTYQDIDDGQRLLRLPHDDGHHHAPRAAARAAGGRCTVVGHDRRRVRRPLGVAALHRVDRRQRCRRARARRSDRSAVRENNT